MTTYRDRHLAGEYRPADAAGPDDWTVAELKDALKAEGKPTTGNKDELLARLAEDNDE